MTVADPHQTFWASQENCSRLYACIKALLPARGWKPEDLAREARALGGLVLPTSTVIINFADGTTKRPQKRREMSGLLQAISTFLDEAASTSPDDEPCAAAARQARELAAKLEKHVASVIEVTERVVPQYAQLKSFFKLMSGFMKIPEEQLLEAYKTFFSEDEASDLAENDSGGALYKHFDLYRSHGNNGTIVKSFMVISLVRYQFGCVCYFANYFRGIAAADVKDFTNRDDVRNTRGIILPTRKMLYLIGEIDGGQGLKVLAMLNPGAPRTVYDGLLTTFNEDQSILSGRFVMKRSKHAHSDQANIAIYPKEKLRGELGENLEKLGGVIQPWKVS